MRRGIVVMPTLATPERTTHTSVPAGVGGVARRPGARRAAAGHARPREGRLHRPRRGDGRPRNRERYAILQRSVAKLAQAGAKVALGSDTGTQDHPFGVTDHRELEMLVEAGMTPMQALVAATEHGGGLSEAARIREPSPGTSAPTSSCSTPIPLDDITNTRRIAAVFVNGREVDRAALAARLASGCDMPTWWPTSWIVVCR